MIIIIIITIIIVIVTATVFWQSYPRDYMVIMKKQMETTLFFVDGQVAVTSGSSGQFARLYP